jgi:hypothetical protein
MHRAVDRGDLGERGTRTWRQVEAADAAERAVGHRAAERDITVVRDHIGVGHLRVGPVADIARGRRLGERQAGRLPCVRERTGDILALFEVDRQGSGSGIAGLGAAVRAGHRTHGIAEAQRPVGDRPVGESIDGKGGDIRVLLRVRVRQAARGREVEVLCTIRDGVLDDRDRRREDDRLGRERAILVAASAVEVDQPRVVGRARDGDGRVAKAPIRPCCDVSAPGQDRVRDARREGDRDAPRVERAQRPAAGAANVPASRGVVVGYFVA